MLKSKIKFLFRSVFFLTEGVHIWQKDCLWRVGNKKGFISLLACNANCYHIWND